MRLLKHLRSSLTYPIAATLVLVTVVPVALVGLLLASYNRDHLTTVEKRFLTVEARSLAGEISEFFSGHRIQLKSTVRGLEAGGEIDVTAIEVLLQDVASEPGREFIYLQILDSRGEGTYVISPALAETTAQILTEAVNGAHEQAIAGHEVEDLLVDLPLGEAVKTIFAFPLRSPDGSAWGSLIGVLDLQVLERRFMENARAGFIVSLFDDHGSILVSSHPQLRRLDMALSPLVRDLLLRPVHLTSTYDHQVPEVAGEVLGSVAPVKAVGWACSSSDRPRRRTLQSA